ncbi:hypothetical protein U8D41_009645 [Mycobacterium shigaense]|nr:hypothetical protein [Mycobacterium shigaense]MEA1123926.1 hypothetical protein [Mycobacterium shigaense]
MGDGPPLFIDADVDILARAFLHSPYSGPIYADWPLDRRLHAFLRRRRCDDGDLCNMVLDRIMAARGATAVSQGTKAGSRSAR